MILTTARKAPKLRRHSTLRSLFKDHSLTLGQVEALSLGESVDQLRKETQVPTLPVTTKQGVLLRLIALNRASYMLAAPEEISALLQAADVPSEQFTILSMDGMPWGQPALPDVQFQHIPRHAGQDQRGHLQSGEDTKPPARRQIRWSHSPTVRRRSLWKSSTRTGTCAWWASQAVCCPCRAEDRSFQIRP